MILAVILIIVAAVGLMYFFVAVGVGMKKTEDGKRHTFSFIFNVAGGEYGAKMGCLVWIGWIVFIIIALVIVQSFI